MQSSARHRTVRSLSGIDEGLMARVEDRLQRGLAPPAEIYQVQNRTKVDWSRIPEWASPIDPDLFEGCGHEG